MKKLTHTDKSGKARMVDVGHKKEQLRTAIAEGFIRLGPETVKLIRENMMKKGDVLTVAQVAGIQAGKRTADLIPLCHNLPVNSIDVITELKDNGVTVKAEARFTGRTGVEMEALTAVTVALLTIYDMCKAVDKEMIIEGIKLAEKTKEDID